MTNREAINIITAKMCLHQAVFGHPIDEPLKTAYETAIAALEKQEADRWIPCKEKMPAKPFGCFVTVMDTNPITQEEFENILPYFAGWDGEQWNDADGEQIPCEVLAWRPLPKPYTEKKS